LHIARSICGPDFFPIQEFAVIKNAGDNAPVLWHQDMLHERKGDCFTVGIYLDEANCGDGALKVVPGSHLSGEGICTLSKSPFIEVAMQPGDILVHDMMLAHSSDPIKINAKRRVIYFEFLSAKHVALEKIYSKELVENRTDLLQVALAYYKHQNPEKETFFWEFENTGALQNEFQWRQRLAKIYTMPINARVSAYCFEQQHY
jgi:ectoine hydroxylase-related dioxygenase (phytanoyl-CoA dioxygenase family)